MPSGPLSGQKLLGYHRCKGKTDPAETHHTINPPPHKRQKICIYGSRKQMCNMSKLENAEQYREKIKDKAEILQKNFITSRTVMKA